MTTKKVPQKRGLKPTMYFKSEKCNDYVYTLSNGSQISFKDKVFPSQQIQQNSNKNQLSLSL